MRTENNSQELHVVGQSVPRRDGLGHVKGTTVYYEDRQLNSLWHMKMVRSPVPHGKLNNVDFSEAEKVRGFVACLTHEDVPNNIALSGMHYKLRAQLIWNLPIGVPPLVLK